MRDAICVGLMLTVVGTAPAADEAPGGGRLVFCCADDNDLYRLLANHKQAGPRFDDPALAIDAAAAGDGVLILAGNYPQQPTAVDVELFQQARRKGLRLYVEYPATIPGGEPVAPRRARLERVVVASPWFGPQLKPLRILAVNGLHFVPLRAEQAHLTAARVAGFDTAMYGLPETQYPILFSLDDDTLVATTKLSHFITGRYAPVDAWRDVWTDLLRWVARDQQLAPPQWTPAVRPAYGRDDALPGDYQREAIRRGAKWYEQSKMIVHPSFAEQVDAAAGGEGIPILPPETPVGDGSLGILEAVLSVVDHDGRQVIGAARRGDCTAESALALALSGAVLDESRYGHIADNALDYYLFESPARKNERADPGHGAYGLIAWGTSSPAWYKANYGDDNARVMLGTLGAAAVQQTDRWDEAMMMCLLANLRTAGPLGFRGSRIDVAPLTQHGWEHYFRARRVNYAPHFECYLWACYLWAYEQTGYELFYDRAATALKMTMARYTDGWRWTNGLAQEKARIVLPLAWLVRVDDTPEHRAMLQQALDGLLELQVECGIIREQLGDLSKGQYPPPRSNEGYGTTEASLIGCNGDPVADLLYTANFAFLGLHEAAHATDDPQIHAACDRLAECLCRIQIRSEAHSYVDGGWFRAFDYQRWEPWGSNADIGWGAWAIESGWTQGWIVSVLAMRQMDTSLWDMTHESTIERHFERLQRQMIPPEATKALEGERIEHAAKGKAVKYAVGPDAIYPDDARSDLTDGRLATADHSDFGWTGWQGANAVITVDLGTSQPIDSVAADCLESPPVGIYLPASMSVLLSDDGTTFREAASLKPTRPGDARPPRRHSVRAELLGKQARYVRLELRNIGVIPPGHRSAGAKAWLFVDEIIVNPVAKKP